MAELTKYCIGKQVEMLRSEINFATYNPRKISDESAATLKRGIKKHGLLGELVVNKTTGNTLVSGHQRITQLDKLEKYTPDTHENDYKVRVNLIEVDSKSEKEIVVLMNNPNAQGDWDYDKLRQIVPDIDYKDAGLTDADLSMIGVDYLYQTDTELGVADDLMRMMQPATEMRQAELAAAKELRAQEKDTQAWQDKIAHMKEVKEQVRQNAAETAGNMDAYIVLSFDNLDNRKAFFDIFGLPDDSKFIKGETVLNLLDIDNEE